MTNDLINIDDVLRLPELAKEIKNLPMKKLGEQYGRITEVKILSWAFNCLIAYTLHRQGYTFKEIQEIILNNEQSPYYVSIETLWRESWIWENILSKAPHLLKDNYLTKSHYKRMSQHKVPNPIEELEYIALRKQEESEKHQKYSISRWEVERGYEKESQGVTCAICGNKAEIYFKVCEICKNLGQNLTGNSDYSVFIKEVNK